MTNYITRPEGKAVDNQLPMQVDDVTQASDRVAAPVETVTFASGAKASSTGVNALDKAPILNLTGDKIGSYWEENKNKMYETARPLDIGTLTETATAADVAITDVDNNLELFFEIASGNRQYVLKAIDGDGNSLYGWIGGVAAASNVYTIDIHNAVTGGAQSWVGTLASFDATDVQRIEIYSYQSSFTWVTGTVLTEEVALPNEEALQSEKKMKEFYDTLSAGQYALNYRTGAIYFKKATTGTSDTCNYNTMASSSATIGDVEADLTKIAGTATNVNGGNRDAGTQTVTLADDDPAVSSLSTLAAVPSKAHTTAYAASLVIKSAPGTLKEIRGYNSGAAQFIQVHDASSLPADTAIPEEVIYVPAAQNFAITPKEGSPFGTGIVVCNSSTGPTKTIGAADCWFSAEYV